MGLNSPLDMRPAVKLQNANNKTNLVAKIQQPYYENGQQFSANIYQLYLVPSTKQPVAAAAARPLTAHMPITENGKTQHILFGLALAVCEVWPRLRLT